MTARRHTEARPGYGDRVTLTSSTSGRTWSGVVLVWGDIGSPYVQLDDTGERRWFPPSWVTAVEPGAGRPPCRCYIPIVEDAHDLWTPEADRIDPDCPEHGDQAAILRKARAGAATT